MSFEINKEGLIHITAANKLIKFLSLLLHKQFGLSDHMHDGMLYTETKDTENWIMIKTDVIIFNINFVNFKIPRNVFNEKNLLWEIINGIQNKTNLYGSN